MNRKWIFALMVAVVIVVVTIFVVDARHDRKLVFDGFIEERLASTKELAGELSARFASVRKDVLFFKYLVEKSTLAKATSASFRSEVGARFERELQALIAVVPHYKEMHLVGPDAGVGLRAREPRWNPGVDADSVARALAAEALRAPQLSEGQVRISAAIHGSGVPAEAPGYRIFSASVRFEGGRRGAVLLLVAPDYLFGTLRSYRAPANPSFVLLGQKRARVSFGSPGLAKLLDREVGKPGKRTWLGERLFSDEPGRTELPEDVAKRLGLSPTTVAAHVPLYPMQEWRWVLVTFVSSEYLANRDQQVILRSMVAMGAVLAGLGALGALLLRQVRRETELREHLRLATEIRHLHELSQKLLDNVPAGLIALDENLRIRQANRVMQALSSGAMPGTSLARALPFAAAGDVERIEALLRSALAAGEVHDLLIERVKLVSDEPGAYNFTAVPMGTPLQGVAILLVVEDLSELKRLERELVRAEKLSTMGILAAGIAHEIGTPLGVVRARAEILQGRLGSDAASMRSLQAIVDQSDVISRIIARVLEFTRARHVHTESLPVGPAVREALELLRDKFAAKNVAVAAAIADDLPPLRADPDGFRQVLLNLLRNASDASKPGGAVALRAYADKTPAGDFVVCEVQDNGCGIPAEHLHSIFDPFFTTKKGGEGTGLGLAIAQDIVKNHGGALSVESTEGIGSTFTLRWRAASGAIGSALKLEAHGAAEHSAQSSTQKERA